MSGQIATLLVPGADLAREFRRLAQGFAGEVNAALARATALDPDGIHDARRWLKRTRGFLRLFEQTLGREFAACDGRLRRISRLVGPMRDIQALHETLVLLAQVAPRELAGDIAEIAAGLEARLPQRPHADDLPVIEKTLAAITEFTEAVARAAPKRIAPEQIRRGVQSTYSRAARRYRAARAEATPDALHALRRQTNHYRQHLRLLTAGWPPVLQARADEASRLHDLLGEDRDLFLLVERMAQDLARPAELRKRHKALLRFIAQYRKERRGDALFLADRLFAEAPADHARRIAAYWAAACAEGRG